VSGHRPAWPGEVRSIGVEDLGRLGLNPDNELFWDGKRIEVRQTLTLTRLQKVLAVIVSVFAILGGLGGFVTGYNNATVFLCARGHDWLSCPASAPQK
jgi:hypothetical protein